ncbi:unnamed protein product [Trichogramma brassicae]|uniref:PDXDC1/PDXD2 second domain-containing protein n=1 Tax=Trichogramma brassicae TaxID=86971 RepID=A0A6H5I784_9HYME|nr:unnamed protein product [Trichogramma brassicae]
MQAAEAANTANAAAAPAVAAAAADNNTEMPIITSAVAAMEMHERNDSNSDSNESTKIAHSITLPLGIWLGIPSLPCVTLYKLVDTKGARLSPRETTLCLVSGLVQDSLSRRLPVLPLWSALQVLGRDGIYNRFKRCFLAIEELYHKIKKFNCIRILSQEPGEGSGTFSMNELLTTAVTSAQLVQSVTSALVFQFVPPNIEDQRIPPYYDKLNSWLGQILERHVENIELEFCELEQYGIAIRISPLESTESPPSSDDIDDVIACLEQQIASSRAPRISTSITCSASQFGAQPRLRCSDPAAAPCPNTRGWCHPGGSRQSESQPIVQSLEPAERQKCTSVVVNAELIINARKSSRNEIVVVNEIDRCHHEHSKVDHESGDRPRGLAYQVAADEPFLARVFTFDAQDSPPISPASTVSGPYIPISECITGRSLFEIHSLNSHDQGGEHYDAPRKLAPSPPRSPTTTDADSVFTDDESSTPIPNVNWETFPSPNEPKGENKSMANISEADANSWSAQKRFGKMKIQETSNTPPPEEVVVPTAPAPPRPPKPSHMFLNNPGHNYLNLDGATESTKPITPLASAPSTPATAIVTDETYDFPRSHQPEAIDPTNTLGRRMRHCYTNAAPTNVTDDGHRVFRYDFHDDEPSSPRSESSGTATYSNLPSPLSRAETVSTLIATPSPTTTPTSSGPTPPVVYRQLKPGRKTSDTRSLISNEPSPDFEPPSINRKLKPPNHKSSHDIDKFGKN